MADDITREQAASVIRTLAEHMMDGLAEALPPDRYPPLTDEEWRTAGLALAAAGIDTARLQADVARAVAAEQITQWLGAKA